MASTRDLWRTSFHRDSVPAFPCPMCDRGNLSLIPDSVKVLESNWATDERNQIGLDPDEMGDWRYTASMRCVVPGCGQIVSMIGTVTLVDTSRDWNERDYTEVFHPTAMSPAPPLATIPSETPVEVTEELKIAFSLFWVDTGSCANRLRIAVERLLDEQRIPRGRSLAGRIATFQATSPDHAETLDALRYVGNLGSHEGKVDKEAILDAFEVLQDALAELYGKRTQRMKALRKKLISSRGEY